MATVNLEQELVARETEYWQAVKDKDVNTALRLTDEPCIVAGPTGSARVDKKALADMMKDAPYTLNEFRIEEPHVRLLGDDVAILAYKVHEQLTVDGKPVSIEAADSSTWVRRPEGWVCALHTESIIGDPFGRR